MLRPDPVVKHRAALDLALSKTRASITRMIEAYQEQVVTLEELRTRMPDLRARETNLRNQLQALDTRIADRDAYLKLAETPQDFLARLRTSARNASIEERRRVLRLLVKNVLIGPEKITIQHRIPIREHPEPPPPTRRVRDNRQVANSVGGVASPVLANPFMAGPAPGLDRSHPGAAASLMMGSTVAGWPGGGSGVSALVAHLFWAYSVSRPRPRLV